MFKLVSLTALIAFSQASNVSADEAKAKKDEKQVKEQFNNDQKKIASMNSSPTAAIWKQLKNSKKVEYWAFQGATEDQSKFSFASTYKKNSDVTASCMDCHMAGNTWDTTHSKCAAATQTVTKDQATYDDAAPTIDHDMTYAEYFTMAQTCFSTPATFCDSTWTDTEAFKAAPPSGKANSKAAYSWKYSYTGSDDISAWSVCQYTATMPFTVKTTEVKGKKTHKNDYAFKGGLLLHQIVPATSSVQPVVQINNSLKNVLYNRASLKVLSVGTTDKIVIPFADTIEVVWTNTEEVKAANVAGFSLEFERQSNSALAVFTIEHGGVIVWVIIGIVVFCLLCVGIIVWKKCFHKEGETFYVDDAYARV